MQSRRFYNSSKREAMEQIMLASQLMFVLDKQIE